MGVKISIIFKRGLLSVESEKPFFVGHAAFISPLQNARNAQKPSAA
jgi:hypothetical protein